MKVSWILGDFFLSGKHEFGKAARLRWFDDAPYVSIHEATLFGPDGASDYGCFLFGDLLRSRVGVGLVCAQ